MRKASKNKHPAMEDRAAIEVLVGTGLSFSAIARRTRKGRKALRRMIRAHPRIAEKPEVRVPQ